ncbi:hypothetical protein RIR_jg28729.t1 [Rhizophagus irregularis DAOM 181602=DAOM 197198]|uniref:Uncharacterized protein n=1 Tax=Rhizophagus irregularis (strain DAOM 197198w) TaxID=1432141 RepID=A0A015K2T8_RHIIW|nr:hypothetical protein RirG_168790 [Rhizophagus irregularis DAOM 197198w]GET63468.1 hypothetical protein RIR_jg28729.t1 [Rhizophagus irregularis DAOM 181602=DAOM 197198]
MSGKTGCNDFLVRQSRHKLLVNYVTHIGSDVHWKLPMKFIGIGSSIGKNWKNWKDADLPMFHVHWKLPIKILGNWT